MKIEEEIKQTTFVNPYQKAVINLMYTANWVYSRQQEFFKHFGITAQQFNILRILRGQYPNSASSSDIKARMLDKNSDVSRLLDRLAAKNLVLRKTCLHDKRATDVYITDEGLDLLKTLDKEQTTLDSYLNLTEDQANRLSDLLDQARIPQK